MTETGFLIFFVSIVGVAIIAAIIVMISFFIFSSLIFKQHMGYLQSILYRIQPTFVKRFDIKGKEYLRTLGKYYLVDIGLRNYLLGYRDRDSGHILENIVYLELLRCGYDVAIGKAGNSEIDFIAVNANEKIYFQVTESMRSETVRERELAPLRKIRDNYKKIILSTDTGLENEFEGIESLNVISWLLDK